MDKRLPLELRKRGCSCEASGLSIDKGCGGQACEATRDASLQQRSRRIQNQEHAAAGTYFPPEVVLLCAQRLAPNEVSCTLRAVCRSARDTLASDPRHCTAQLSEPLLPHVATWSPGALHGAVTALQQLSFVRKLCLPALAATSGCTTNLEVAWRLVSPCLCPQLPLRLYTSQLPERADAGVAAARMGLSDLVVWLVERRCPLVPARVARAAAVHCSLAGLREVWGALLRLDPGLGAEAEACWREVKNVADGEAEAREAGRGEGGGSGGGMPCMDVQEKAAWLYEQHQRHQQQQQERQEQHEQEVHMPYGVQQQAAAAAALPVAAQVPPGWWLWSWRRGDSALQCGPRCSCCAPSWRLLPPDPNGTAAHDRLYHAAWEGAVEGVRDMLVHMGELQQEGQQQQEGQGQAEADQQQVEGPPPPQQQQQPQQGGDSLSQWKARSAFDRALRAGSIVAARTMLQAGYRPSNGCYQVAASSGHLHCLRWLLLEARPCPFGYYRDFFSLLGYWPVATTAEQEQEAMEVLRLLVEAGCTGEKEALWRAAARRGSLPLLLEALRLVPPSQCKVKSKCGGGGSNGGRSDGSRGGGGGMSPQPCIPASLLPFLAEGGCEAALELCVRGLGTPVLSECLDSCCDAWAEAAWRGDMATLECLRRLGVPWDCKTYGRELKASAPLGSAQTWNAPLTLPVLRWAVEEVGCWELHAGACRQLAGCLEVCLQQAREWAVKKGQAGADGGGGEDRGGRGEWGPVLGLDWGVYMRAMETMVAWLKERGGAVGQGGRAGALHHGGAAVGTGLLVDRWHGNGNGFALLGSWLHTVS